MLPHAPPTRIHTHTLMLAYKQIYTETQSGTPTRKRLYGRKDASCNTQMIVYADRISVYICAQLWAFM